MRYSLDTTGLSARNLAILARGVRGGDGSSERSLEDILVDAENADHVAGLDDEALGALIEETRAAAKALVTSDTSDEAIAAGRRGLEAVKALTQVVDERAAEAQRQQDAANELLAELDADGTEEAEGDDGETDEATEPEVETEEAPEAAEEVETEAAETEATEEAEPEAEEVAEPIAASAPAAKPKAPRAAAPIRTRPRRPDMGVRAANSRAGHVDSERLVLRASSNVNGFNAGQLLTTQEERGAAFAEAIQRGWEHRGPETPVLVASAGNMFQVEEMYGTERHLDMNERENERKIAFEQSPERIAASGGQCAPSEVVYTQPIIGVDDRPVKGALLNFGASRGGVRLIPPPQFSDVSGAIGTWEMATDTTPGLATKPVLTMTCPNPVETFVGAITNSIKIGNFRNLYWSEQVDAFIGKAAVYAARVAERRLLTNIGTGSTNISAGQHFGSARDTLANLDLALARLRNSNRVSLNQPVRMIAPAWLLNNMRADLVRQTPGDSGGGIERLSSTDAEIQAWFANRNVNITWALDGESGQEFAAQAAGPINGWPSTAVVYLYIEGSWLYLDGGQLNLGVIRDSTLVGTNDFIMFAEFMENVAFHGTESIRLALDICPDGSAQAVETTRIALCTGDS